MKRVIKVLIFKMIPEYINNQINEITIGIVKTVQKLIILDPTLILTT